MYSSNNQKNNDFQYNNNNYAIDVNQIHNILEHRQKQRIDIYEKILTKCFIKIKSSVDMDDTFTIFQIPEFVLGEPCYRLDQCIEYIIYSLKNRGFEIKYVYPNILNIYWGKPTLQIENYTKPKNNFIKNNNNNTPLLTSSSFIQKPIINRNKNNKFALDLSDIRSSPQSNSEKKIKMVSEYIPSGKFISLKK
jgi:hypothetical protein